MQCSLPLDGGIIEDSINDDWKSLFVFEAVAETNVTSIGSLNVLGFAHIECADKWPERGGNGFKYCGFTLPVTCGNDRQLRMEVDFNVFKSTEIL